MLGLVCDGAQLNGTLVALGIARTSGARTPLVAAATFATVIIWLNGTFGVGKTTLSETYIKHFNNCRIFNPEHVGYMLGGNLRDIDYYDFKDLPPWRNLVPRVLHEVAEFTGADIVAPQSVLTEAYWHELRSGMDDLGLHVLHVVLDCELSRLTSRIENDPANPEPEAIKWRMDHVESFAAARMWLRDAADLWLDTTNQETGRAGEGGAPRSFRKRLTASTVRLRNSPARTA